SSVVLFQGKLHDALRIAVTVRLKELQISCLTLDRRTDRRPNVPAISLLHIRLSVLGKIEKNRVHLLDLDTAHVPACVIVIRPLLIRDKTAVHVEGDALDRTEMIDQLSQSVRQRSSMRRDRIARMELLPGRGVDSRRQLTAVVEFRD